MVRTIIGGVTGAIGAVSSAMRSGQPVRWQNVVGAAVGGAAGAFVGSMMDKIPGSSVWMAGARNAVEGFVDGAVTSFVSGALTVATDKESGLTMRDVLVDTAVSGVMGAGIGFASGVGFAAAQRGASRLLSGGGRSSAPDVDTPSSTSNRGPMQDAPDPPSTGSSARSTSSSGSRSSTEQLEELGELVAMGQAAATRTNTPDVDVDVPTTNHRSVEEMAAAIPNADRVGSGQKPDAYHRGASFIPEEQLASGQTFPHTSGDGSQGTLLQTNGGMNGKTGIFEYLMNQAGEIVHQRFIPGGEINGIINFG